MLCNYLSVSYCNNLWIENQHYISSSEADQGIMHLFVFCLQSKTGFICNTTNYLINDANLERGVLIGISFSFQLIKPLNQTTLWLIIMVSSGYICTVLMENILIITRLYRYIFKNWIFSINCLEVNMEFQFFICLALSLLRVLIKLKFWIIFI